MEEFITLEKELTVRIMLHKAAIVKAACMKEYMDKELAKGGIQLPIGIIERNAEEYTNNKMLNLAHKGLFDEAYEQAWDKISACMPDNFGVLN